MDKKLIAANLAELLRDLADAAERAGNGDEAAKRLLAQHIDGHWHALVIGNSRDCDVQRLIGDDE